MPPGTVALRYRPPDLNIEVRKILNLFVEIPRRLIIAFFLHLMAKAGSNLSPFETVHERRLQTTENTEWQWPLFWLHSIMMVKSAQSERVGVHTYPFSLYLPSRAKLSCTLQRKGHIHSPYFPSRLCSGRAISHSSVVDPHLDLDRICSRIGSRRAKIPTKIEKSE